MNKFVYISRIRDIICIHCAITAIKLSNTPITSHGYFYFSSFFFVRTCKIYSPSKFPVHNTLLLTIVTMFYIRSSECIDLKTKSLCSLTNISPLPLRPSYSLFYSFYEFDFFL